MRMWMAAMAAVGAAGLAGAADEDKAADKPAKVGPALKFTVKSLDGKSVDLAKYQGKVVLVVNTASQCGLTPQYKGLQALHEAHKDAGLAVLGFPCNQFGSQEPGTEEEIGQFCKDNYNVSFDLFAKIEVNGEGANDLYKYLTAGGPKHKAGPIAWNFEKFLIGRDGNVVARFSPRIAPDAPEVVKAIKAELAKKPAADAKKPAADLN